MPSSRRWLAGVGQAPSADVGMAAAAGAAAAPSSERLRIAILDLDRGAASATTTADSEPARHAAWARRIQQQSGTPSITLVNASSTLLELRQIKTPYEQTVLRRSVDISAEAHLEGMKVARPGRWEYEIEAAIEHGFLKSGRSPGDIRPSWAAVRTPPRCTTCVRRVRCSPVTLSWSTRLGTFKG